MYVYEYRLEHKLSEKQTVFYGGTFITDYPIVYNSHFQAALDSLRQRWQIKKGVVTMTDLARIDSRLDGFTLVNL